MSRSKHRTYPKSNEKEENETLQTLKAANKRLKKTIEQLKQEILTLEKAFKQTGRYLKDNTDGFSVEAVIKGVQKDKTLQQLKDESGCSKCGSINLRSMSGGRGFHVRFCNDCKNTEKVLDET